MMLKVFVAFVFIFSFSPFAQAQSTSGKQKDIVDQTIAYLKRLSVVSIDWTNNPEKTELQKEMNSLVKSFDNIKESISAVLIVNGRETDKRVLLELLKDHKADTDALVEQLLLWKYQVKDSPQLEMFMQLDQIHAASKEILALLENEQNWDDAITVLLCQSAAESTIQPLSDEFINQLSKLKLN